MRGLDAGPRDGPDRLAVLGGRIGPGVKAMTWAVRGANPGGEGHRQRLRTGRRRQPGVRPPRPAHPADLPHAGATRAARRTEGLYRSGLRPAPGCRPCPTRREDHSGVGQRPAAPQPPHARGEARGSWLTVFQLPAYAPELNPAEGVWSSLRRGLANLAPHGIDELAAAVKTRLKRMQYRRDGLLDGFIAEIGFTLEPP